MEEPSLKRLPEFPPTSIAEVTVPVYTSSKTAAESWGCSPRTIRTWAQDGKISRQRQADGTYLYAANPNVNRIPQPEDPPSPRPKSTVKRAKMVVFASDFHVPHEDPDLLEAFLKFCRDTKPDEVILGGDIMDNAASSAYGGNANKPKLIDEVNACRTFLDKVRSANPRATITFLGGNHDQDRLERFIADHAPTLEGCVDLPTLLGLPERDIKFHPYGEVVFRGKLGFTHGFYFNDTHAQQHVRKFGCNLVWGHTHRPQMYTCGIAGDEVRGGFGVGCMSKTKDVPYLKGRPSGWLQGFGVFYVEPDGNFYPYLVLCNDSSFIWAGKKYSK
jgi:predicted phosphodiesterase